MKEPAVSVADPEIELICSGKRTVLALRPTWATEMCMCDQGRDAARGERDDGVGDLVAPQGVSTWEAGFSFAGGGGVDRALRPDPSPPKRGLN